jgi:hypothetical protein
MAVDNDLSRKETIRYSEDTRYQAQPYYLRDGQHILDQPPYSGLYELVPDNFFQGPESQPTREARMFRFLDDLRSFHWMHAKSLPATREGFTEVNADDWLNDVLNSINPDARKQRSVQDILIRLQSIERELSHYPYAEKYLVDKKEGFDKDGFPQRDPQEKGYHPEMTFAAYQHAQISFSRDAKLAGISKELPGGFTDAETVKDAMPPKHPVNTMYRLLVQSEALR